jgi:hypothetical protein
MYYMSPIMSLHKETNYSCIFNITDDGTTLQVAEVHARPIKKADTAS